MNKSWQLVVLFCLIALLVCSLPSSDDTSNTSLIPTLPGEPLIDLTRNEEPIGLDPLTDGRSLDFDHYSHHPHHEAQLDGLSFQLRDHPLELSEAPRLMHPVLTRVQPLDGLNYTSPDGEFGFRLEFIPQHSPFETVSDLESFFDPPIIMFFEDRPGEPNLLANRRFISRLLESYADTTSDTIPGLRF